MFYDILQKIREYDKISIYRHQRPDGDAMFSAMAMESFLKDNFPEKEVKVAGEDRFDLVSRNDQIDDAFIEASLAIILDTSTSDRIDDERAKKASCIIKIDHHPMNDDYGMINLVVPKASACAELIAKMFFSKEFKGFVLSEKTCEYLYCGIVSDTINFRTTNVTAETLMIASKLIRKGKLEVAALVEYVMDKDLDYFKTSTAIRSKLKIDHSFGYIILKQKDLDKLQVSQADAKNNIDEIGRIKQLKIWAIAVESEGLYDVSIRSKKGYTINTVAASYGGGGHVNAAGVKGLTKRSLSKMFSTLSEMSLR